MSATSSFLKVLKPTHNNATGFWGSTDTTVTFCEPHYVMSQYIAEFHNAWTSLAFYGLVGYYMYRKFALKDSYVQIAGMWLMAIGAGSCLFHSTMKFSMQLLDEGPMVGFMATILLAKATSKNHAGIVKYSIYIQAWIYLQCISVIVLYLYFEVYEIFLHGFTCIVMTDVVLGHLLRSKGRHSKIQLKATIISTICILSGRIVWEIENRFCKDVPTVWPLHAVWHLLSCGSAYYSCLMAYLCRLEEAGSSSNSSTTNDGAIPMRLVGLWKPRDKKQKST